jgi:hypothetical protein
MIDKNEMLAFTSQFTNSLYQSGYISAGEKLQADYGAVQAVTILEEGVTKGGFKSLNGSVIEGQTVSDGPIMTKLTNDGPVKIETTNTKTASQSAITGKSSGNGQLKIALVQGSPAAFKSVLKGVMKAQDSQIKSVSSETSSQPNLVVNAIDKDQKSELSKEVKKTVAENNRKLSNPIASDTDPFGSLGGKFGNLFATIASAVSGGESFKTVGEELKDKTTEIIDPVTGQKTNPNIVNVDGTTNIKNTVSKSAIGNSVSNSDTPFDAVENGKKFGTKSYKYEPVDTAEELELELKKCNRELTTVVTSWLEFPINFNGTLENYSDLIKKRDQQVLDQFSGAFGAGASGFFQQFSGIINSIDLGIQEHYVILRNGKVFRGRPLAKPIAKTEDTKWTKGVISIAFWAGSTEPFENPKWRSYMSVKSISTEQWKAFDLITDTFLKVFPGGSVVSLDKINKEKTPNPGFDAAEYVKSKFGKENVYDDEDYELYEPYTAEEKVEKKPATVVIPSIDPSEVPSIEDLNKKASDIANIDNLTGLKKDIDAAQISTDYNKAISDANNALRQKDGILGEAMKIGTGLLGGFSNAANSTESSLTSALNSAQGFRQKAIDAGYTYDPVTKSWNK